MRPTAILAVLAALLTIGDSCVLCPLRVPPRPRPLDQFKIPRLPKVNTESIPKFCNLTQWLPVGDSCRDGISRVLCSADILIDAYTNGCPDSSQPQQCSACERSKPENFWVISWFDSLGKMPAGVSDGNYYWLGDYEICHDLHREKKFDGQYCLLRLEVPDALVEAGCPQTDPLEIIYGMCAPIECTDEEIENIARAYVPYKVRVDCELEPDSLVAKIVMGIIIAYKLTVVAFTIMNSKHKGPNWFEKFSLNYNGQLTLSTKRTFNKNLHVISGLEFLSYFMLIAGNVYNIMLPYIQNVAFAFDEVSNIFAHLSNNYSYHVDGLLALSSYLTASLLYGNLNRMIDVVETWAKALVRFWPNYALLIMYMSILFPHGASGPMWIHGSIEKRCSASWWKNLLFINNLFDVHDTCVDFGYVISLMAQYFIIVTIFCYLARDHIRVVMHLCWVGVLASIAYNFCMIFIFELPPAPVLTAEPIDHAKMESLLNLVVINPLGRLAPALIGVLFALVPKKDIHIAKRTLLIFIAAVLAALVGFFLINYTSGHAVHPVILALYGALHRPLWALVLMILAYVCTYGGGLETVEAFLGWRVWSPISKSVVTALVISEPLILHFFSSLHRPAYATHWSTIYAIVSAAAISLKLALILNIFYGRPFRNIYEWTTFRALPTDIDEAETKGPYGVDIEDAIEEIEMEERDEQSDEVNGEVRENGENALREGRNEA